jgi:transposase
LTAALLTVLLLVVTAARHPISLMRRFHARGGYVLVVREQVRRLEMVSHIRTRRIQCDTIVPPPETGTTGK